MLEEVKNNVRPLMKNVSALKPFMFHLIVMLTVTKRIISAIRFQAIVKTRFEAARN